ncbi:unnamed protein product [Closterium sp. NIES-53]
MEANFDERAERVLPAPKLTYRIDLSLLTTTPAHQLTHHLEATRYVWHLNLPSKDMAFEAFIAWLPQGVAERMNQTLQNTMRKLLRCMRLPNHQWPEAMDHAVMLHNLLSSSSLPNNASPHLLWTGKQGSTKMLRWGLHLGIEKNYNAWKIFDVHSKETVAARDVLFYERLTLPTYLANLEENQDPIGGFHGDRHFASAADEANWDEQNVDNASEEAGPLPYCSMPIPMDDENPRESVNAETYFDLADTGYVTPAKVNTNEAGVWPNFIPDPEAGDEAPYPADTTLPHYTPSGLLILGLVTAFPEAVETPRWGELSRAGGPIFDLDFDAILAAMYAMTISEEGDCYRCFPPDSGIGTSALGAGEASALGASASVLSGTGETALSGTASASAPLTFTLDSGASRSFFRDRTTLTPLSRPVAVSLADPSGGPLLSRFSTVLPCPAAPSGTLSGLYLPSFSTNLVSGAALQDAGVHQFAPAGQRVTHCTEALTGRHLATFTRTPGSSLYTLTTASPPVPASGRVPLSGQVFAAASRSGLESAPCSCRRLSHETLLWHHRLGHPSLPRLRGMASRFLVSGLPRSLPPLPQGPGPTCVPCVEGRQRAAPHSSQFPPTEAPLQTLHLDVWGPARVRGLGHERYFLLVVDDFSRYTTVFPLRSNGDVTEVLIDWIRAARLQLRQSFGSDFPVLRLHSDRGGEFSSGLLRAFCRARGIRQTFTLPDSPQQNGITERRIGMVMDVARTSMMHAAAPHFLWPFAVRYAAHQINLHPRVSRPETSPALLWTGKVGDASAFRVWGSRAFVRDLSANKLSSRTSPCVFLGFPPDAPGWHFALLCFA